MFTDGYVKQHEKNQTDPYLRATLFISWYFTLFAMAERLSHLTSKSVVAEAHFSTLRVELNTKNVTERPVPGGICFHFWCSRGHGI